MKTIEVKELTKYYKTNKALDCLNFTIEPGKIYGLLGRNGAGKTTLLNLMTGRIFPTEGEIRIDGENVHENDKVLGSIFYMTEKNLYPVEERVKNIFKWSRQFYPKFDMEYARDLADKFGLDTNKKVKNLSTGYTSIFKAVTALASNADIMLFDEPVLGLDANHRDMLYKELLANYAQNPRTIIISTHLIEEVARVLEDVIIIKEGKLIVKSPVEELLACSYTATGEVSKIDKYIEGRKYTGIEQTGNLKSVIVLEDNKKRNTGLAKELGIDFSKTELQKLFISLTN
ncbi:MAG: ABC transporter ATP-binding protein [Clostridiales bacterium]|nr:ABC transporter ATP-binding protein [Clostridiales bacterium]